jgi:hypothetical protein
MSVLNNVVSGFMLVLLVLFPLVVEAQCAMCRATAESSEYSAGINTGVLYLLAFPFLVIVGGGLFWYFNRNKFQANSWDN